MVDDRETRARYRADQLAVYALEFVGADGTLERYDEVLFAAPGEIGKSDPGRALRAASQAHRVRCRRASPARRHGPSRCRARCRTRRLRAQGARARRIGAGHADGAARVQPDVQDARRRARGQPSVTYLRPETAQGIFVNFKNVCDRTRVRVPFGIAQIGKSFRNEITPRNFTFRWREFEQMEIEFFCHPSDAAQWYQYWRDRRYRWYLDLGLAGEPAPARARAGRARALLGGHRRHRVRLPVRPQRARRHRPSRRLRSAQHMQMSGKDLRYFDDQEPNEEARRYLAARHRAVGRRRPRHARVPLRGLSARTRSAASARTVLKLHPRLAPIKAAVFPLVKKDGMPEMALEIYRALKKRFNVFYDEKGAVGRRYRRQDEAGHAVLHHRRRPDAERRHGDGPRARQLRADARRRRRARGRS